MEEHEPNGDTKNETKHSDDNADISDEGVSLVTISLFICNQLQCLRAYEIKLLLYENTTNIISVTRIQGGHVLGDP